MMAGLVRPEPRWNVYEVPFWNYVQERQVHLQRCDECGHMRYPPSPVCPRCLADGSTWTPLAGTGRLLSWVVFRRRYFDELPVPYCVAAGEAKEGPILMANLVNLGERIPILDMPLRLTYEEAHTSEGEPWLIYQWEPLR